MMKSSNCVLMSIATSLLLLLTLISHVNCRLVHKIDDFRDPMPPFVNECRRGCLLKFLDDQFNAPNAIAKCSLTPNCFMCWDYCSMLFKDRKKRLMTKMMCSDSYCFPGCKFACHYYRYLLEKPVAASNQLFH